MKDLNFYFDTLKSCINTLTLAQTRIGTIAGRQFERGEELIYDRVFNKQVPEILRRLIYTLGIEQQCESELQTTDLSEFLSAVQQSFIINENLWNAAIDHCNRKTLLAMVIIALEKVVIDAGMVAAVIEQTNKL